MAGKNAGEQVHLGAALWNRGNVVVGFFGKWNGHPSNDRRMVTMDLGLVATNDALHYREPIPDFPIVSVAEDGWGMKRRESLVLNFPALIRPTTAASGRTQADRTPTSSRRLPTWRVGRPGSP